MVTRSKFAKASTATVAPQVEEATIIDRQDDETVFANYSKAFDAAMSRIKLSINVRHVLGYIASFITAFATGWIVGALFEMLAVSVVLFTGVGMLGIMIWIIGFLLSIYLAINFGTRVGMYVATAPIGQQLSDAKSKVLGWFKPKTAVAA